MRKAMQFALLNLVLVPACGVSKQTLVASTPLRQRITEFAISLSETMPGSTTTTIGDRAVIKSLIVLVNLSLTISHDIFSQGTQSREINTPSASKPPASRQRLYLRKHHL